jgi:hypothetical protein
MCSLAHANLALDVHRYCGGLGHRVAQCPKRESTQQKLNEAVGRSDFVRDNEAEF